MALKLNQSFPIGDNPFRPFCPAPNDVQLAIHKLPTAYLPQDPNELCAALAESIRNAIEVPIFNARFLQPDPVKRFNTSSVVISVSPNDVQKFGSSIRLYSQPRRVEPANSGNRFTQCRRCWRYGHIAIVCKADRSVCPLCSNSHIRSAHRCSNPTCPAGGNLKAVPKTALPLQPRQKKKPHQIFRRAPTSLVNNQTSTLHPLTLKTFHQQIIPYY